MAKEDIVKYQFTSDQSRTKAAENGRKGGIASGKAKRRKKAAREVIQMLAEEPITNKSLRKSVKGIANGIDEDDIDMIMGATMGLFQAAIKGNVSAYELIANNLDAAYLEDEQQEDELSRSLRELAEEMNNA